MTSKKGRAENGNSECHSGQAQPAIAVACYVTLMLMPTNKSRRMWPSVRACERAMVLT